MTVTVEGVIARAGRPNRNGDVLFAEELRQLADGRSLFWDEERQVLLFRGEVEQIGPATFVWVPPL